MIADLVCAVFGHWYGGPADGRLFRTWECLRCGHLNHRLLSSCEPGSASVPWLGVPSVDKRPRRPAQS